MQIVIDIPKEVYKGLVDDTHIFVKPILDAIKNGIPLDKIRAEVEKVFCMSVVTNELRTPMEVKTEILQIIDKYR